MHRFEIPGSSEVFVESAARQPVWVSEVSQRIDFREVASAEAMDRARAALGRAVEIGGLVLLEGADLAGVSALLQQVASGVERDVSPLIIGGERLPPDAFARRVLEAVGHTSGDAPRRVLEHYADALVARGAALLLLVDAADSLPAETVRWLAALTCGATPRSRVVLAATDHQAFLESLAGLGSCVDIVRLETDSRVSVSGADADAGADVDDDHEVAVVPWSQAETTGSPDPTLCESTWKTTNEPEDREADEPPQSATPDDHLHTIEELLGEGGWIVPAQSDPRAGPVGSLDGLEGGDRFLRLPATPDGKPLGEGELEVGEPVGAREHRFADLVHIHGDGVGGAAGVAHPASKG